jgi:hypothetical protein
MNLLPFEGTPSFQIRADASYRDGWLEVVFEMEGDMRGVNWPSRELGVERPMRRDELWRATCFEVFLTAGASDYVEVNLSPSGAWNVYRFDRYREGMRPAELLNPPRIEASETEARRRLAASLDLTLLFPEVPGALSLRAGLCAVIESSKSEGPLSYWALRHAVGKPDFHHPDSFVLEL